MNNVQLSRDLVERLSNCKASEPEQLYYLQKELRAALAEPTSAEYALGYADGFNDACKPKPEQSEPFMGNSHESNMGKSHITECHQKEAFESPGNRVLDQAAMLGIQLDSIRNFCQHGKPDGMTDEGWRQLTEVIPFRIRQVMRGNFMSLPVLMTCIDIVAREVGLQDAVRQGLLPMAPPRREPLTDEQIADFLGDEYHSMTTEQLRFFRLGEAAHGIGGKE